MINIGGKYVSSLMVGGKMLSVLYRDGKIIWQGIRSCFGRGTWYNEKPWINTDLWKNS